MKTSEILVFIVLSSLLNIVQVKAEVEVWNNTYSDTSVDFEATILLAKKLKYEQETIAEQQAILRRYLRTKNAELLANILSINRYSDNSTKLKNVIKNISKNYDTQLIEDILYDAIYDIFSSQRPSLLIDSLWDIYTAGDPASFELMLRAQLKLMRFYNEKSYCDDKEFFCKYAFTLYKIKHDNLYGSIKGYLKSALDLVVTKLPNNLQYFFFYPYFCLMNSKYSEYIYTAIEAKIDEASRYIWLWFDKLQIDGTGHIMAEIFESNAGNNTHFKVRLKGTTYQLYYYMMPSTYAVAGWELNEQEPMHSIWDIEFLDNDRVVFSQNDYIMCSSEEMFDTKRRKVAGYKGGNYTTLSEECQWHLGQCNRLK